MLLNKSNHKQIYKQHVSQANQRHFVAMTRQ